jgi:TRAP-type mannitol/chloroaromatic compound transport system permease small subunit
MVIKELIAIVSCGFLAPMLAAPIAALLAQGRRVLSLLLLFGFLGSVFLAAYVFAKLSVPIDPPASSLRLATYGATGGAIVGAAFLAIGPDKLIAHAQKLFEGAVSAIGKLALPIIGMMALLQFVAVILRYVFGLNSIFVQESITYMHASCFMLAAGYALLTGDHVRVDVMRRGMSERGCAAVDLVGAYLFLAPFVFVVLWASAPYVATSWAIKEGSTEQSGIQALYLLKSLIPAMAIMLALAGFSTAVRAVRILKKSAA